MSILEHLDQLTSAPGEHAAQNFDSKQLDVWIMPRSFTTTDVDDDLEKDFRPSITDIFNADQDLLLVPAHPHHLVKRLSNKPKEVIDAVSSLLSSAHPDDAISGELADLVGFEDIELVAEILASRSYFVNTLPGWEQTVVTSPTIEKAGTPRIGTAIASLAPQDVRRRMEETLRANASRPLFTGTAQEAPEVLPHVYSSSAVVQGGSLSQFGSKYALPLGTARHDYEEYEEVIIPPAKVVPPRETERLIFVSELDSLAKGSFPGYSTLNRVQSIIFPTAYGSNENILVCAPTGAGKTDVAMLAILRVLNQHRLPINSSSPLHASIDRNAFQIIYVAPMKALASEIVRKLGKRLQWLSIKVKELTGDMQLTKAEIAETQIIVTTPEKWDVVTRKPTGEGELASKLKLLIIDEVHLLNEERGAVIETIVARTLRQVESSQSVIRIVGLSATLPNYLDVAEFLSVSRYTGLFFFDSSFRPIPLEQHFIGVRGKPGSPQAKRNLDRVTYQKVSELVKEGHQVMVFVHSRKETVKAAQALKDSATIDGTLDDYSCEEHPQWPFFRRNIGESRNKEMKQLFDQGFGIHHAGMLRSDRNMMERMFEARAIKVLCCTATLAWGVNLPAHAVVIKGTQLYDSARGSFVDLSVLDVLQVFGRAGRPGLETRGEGYICTTEDKLQHYLDAVTSQNPIESRFTSGIDDALNAEIALGTVTNVVEGVSWLGYTYLFVRMRKNPLQYGMPRDIVLEDPQLGQKREHLVTLAARKLASAGMINYTQKTKTFSTTDLGRIAARYYIRYASIEVFNNEFRPKMTEADVLAMLSMSTEFEQIKVRESEVKELEVLMKNIPCAVRGETHTNQGKVCILLQSYISRFPIEDFALVSDAAYVAQNGGRIARALLDIAISRKWATAATVLMGLTKAIEKRLWPFDEPLRQFDLKAEIIYGLQNSGEEYSPAELASMTAAELGELVRLNERHGQALRNAAQQFPMVKMASSLRPLGSDVLKIAVSVTRDFNWSSKVHDSGEPFWLWIEDHEGVEILQFMHLLFRESTKTLDVNFVVSMPSNIPPYFTIRFVSDRWIGAEDEHHVSLDGLVMPAPSLDHTSRLDLPFLSLSSLVFPVLQEVYSPQLLEFNAIQTQVFWGLINTSMNVLISAPVSCGKSLMGYLAIWVSLLRRSKSFALLVVPNRSLAIQSLLDFRAVSDAFDVAVELSSAEGVFASCQTNVIRIITSSGLLEAIDKRNSRPTRPTSYPCLVVCDNLEQLDASYELSISLLRHITQNHPTRYVGLSSSLNDSTDLASWIGVDTRALYSFRPTDRDQSLIIEYQTFTVPHSAALFRSMSKPAYTAIQRLQSNESALIFVPSRSHCRTVAQELITLCTLDTESERGFLPHSVSLHLEDYSVRLQDPTLVDFVTHGVGIFHNGLSKADRSLVLELFAEGVIRVLLAPRDACWMLPVRAAVVVVMGTQYIHFERDGSGSQLRDYSLIDVVRMQSRAVRHGAPGHFFLFCQAEARHTFAKFLADGLPLESELLESSVFENWYKARRDGAIRNKQDAVQALSFTFLARRLVSNPMYYDGEAGSRNEVLSRIVDRLEESLL